jgi:hypothetical protein
MFQIDLSNEWKAATERMLQPLPAALLLTAEAALGLNGKGAALS